MTASCLQTKQQPQSDSISLRLSVCTLEIRLQSKISTSLLLQYKQILNAFQSDYLWTSSQLHVKRKSVSINQFSSNEKCISFTFAASSSFEKAHAKTDISPDSPGWVILSVKPLHSHLVYVPFQMLQATKTAVSKLCIFVEKWNAISASVCVSHSVCMTKNKFLTRQMLCLCKQQ